MKKHYSPTKQQPKIVKYIQTNRGEVHPHKILRHGLGFVIKGRKYIYTGDNRETIEKGNIFFLNAGYHYTEEEPDENGLYEQIIVYYSQKEISSILAQLGMVYGVKIDNDHSCSACQEKEYVIYPAWGAITSYFSTLNQYLKEGVFMVDKTAETLKMTELLYLILSKEECCLKSKFLSNADSHEENFKQIIHQNIFNNISIDQLAKECNYSLTLFKREFKKHFNDSPHRWFVRQRVIYSRLLLISTNMSVSEIGIECSFPNTSHFIKLFKREYTVTPSVYRTMHREGKVDDKSGTDEPEGEVNGERSLAKTILKDIKGGSMKRGKECANSAVIGSMMMSRL